MRSRHLSRVIPAHPSEVYEYAANPDNLPTWAAGLARSEVTRDGDTLFADSPMGRVVIRFVAHNQYGILDHDVILPSGATVNNPIRVLAHPDGAEIVFTIRQLDLGDDEFERDCRLVEEDLDRLAQLFIA